MSRPEPAPPALAFAETPASDAGADLGRGLTAVVLATTSFSLGFVVVKAIPLEAGPLSVLRLAVGAVVLTAAAVVLRAPWPRRWRLPFLTGVVFGVHQLVFTLATQQTSIAIVTLLGAMQPLVIALLGMALQRRSGRRVARGTLVAALLAASGVLVVIVANTDDPSRSLSGDLLAVLNLFVFTAFFLCARRSRAQGAPTLTFTATFLATAGVVVLPYALLRGESFAATPFALGMVVLLALVPGNGHLLLSWAHPRVPAALSSLVLAGIPLLASLWAALVFDEPYGLPHVAGMLLVVTAIEVGRRAERRARLGDTVVTPEVLHEPAGSISGGRR